jgi:transposase
MEDVLSVYQRPVSESEPLVCMDETSKQHVKQTRLPLPCRAGDVEKYDYEYERNGVSNLFMVSAPLIGWRHVKVTDRHTCHDWALLMREIVDVHFPNAKRVVVVMDNLNTHKPSSLYKAFPASEAKRILDRLEFHYTPKHGSWLNMAEIEFGILQRQCLNRRIPGQETLRDQVAAWQQRRNTEAVEVNWRFTTQDARIKLKRLYPSIHC